MTPTFGDIKSKVDAMIAEAKEMNPSSPWYVSAMWEESLLYLNYVRDLPDHQLVYLRIHTSFITGVFTLQTLHDPARFRWEDSGAREDHTLVKYYRECVEGLPEPFWCSEPAPNTVVERIGYRWRGKLLTHDLIRYQCAVTNLHNMGLISPAPGPRKTILEIGGGYGGFAHQLSNVCEAVGSACCYVIVDLPEMLFWAAVNLRLNNPDKKIYVFDRKTFSYQHLPALFQENDFVLLPHYILENCAAFPQIDLAINMLSFQEMKEIQVRAYCEFLNRHLKGWLFSENFLRHVFNQELGLDLYDIFSDYFEMVPEEKALMPGATTSNWALRLCLGTPKSNPQPLNVIKPDVHVL